MADVFISYKSERRAAARHLADLIEAHGFSVWFDYALVPGKNFGRHIEAELRAAKAVVTLWCPLSVSSEWVQNEAALAKRLGKLVPARIAPCDPSLEFLRDDYVDISGWDGDPSTRQLDRLIDRIEALVGRDAQIDRRRLIELHNAWATYGRPAMAQFALGPRLDVPDSELVLPSLPKDREAKAPVGAQRFLPAAEPHPSGFNVRRSHMGLLAGACAGALLLGYSGLYFAGVPVPWPTASPSKPRDKGIDPAQAAKEQARIAALEERIRQAEAEVKRQADLAAKAKGDLEARQKAEAEAAAKRKADEDAAKAKAEADRRAAADAESRRVAALKAEEDRQRIAAEAKRKADEEAARRDPASAVRPGSGQSFRDCNDGCPELVVVPAGKFMMGEGSSAREVAIAQAFAVGKFEVTFEEWDACVAGGGCTSNRSPRDEGWGKGRRPVINVSWNDAKEYVAWLSRKTGKTYRLLSEAEWEYAARAGTTTTYSWGNVIGRGNANCDGCGSQWDNKQTAPVGSLKPNSWGLLDMHGNVFEWVEDAFDSSSRVLRGGSWGSYPQFLRSTFRIRFQPANRDGYVGFRVARTL